MNSPAHEPTPTPTLAERLRQRIRREGAISFRDWMEAALYDEREGYYARRDLRRWGRAGDYRTSPERSPLFAATLARYFATLYAELDEPQGWTILEAGAGAGDFARVLLETLESDFPRVFAATRYLIDEASEDARERARRALMRYGEIVQFAHLSDLDRAFETGIIFCNELFDALPVHRVVMRGGALRELCVGLDAAGDFVWTERDVTTTALADFFERQGARLPEGRQAEVCLDAELWMAAATRAVRRGFLVASDYGAEASELFDAPHRREGTLRGFSRHRFADNLLANPGAQDLTYTVNWTHLRSVAVRAGWQTVLHERQDAFLLRAGALEQLERLTAKAASEAERVALHLGAREMILPGGMSESFQVLVWRKD